MAENEDPAEAALRLEAALDRIARQMHRPPGTDAGRIAARLDALIAQLRAALGAGAGT